MTKDIIIKDLEERLRIAEARLKQADDYIERCAEQESELAKAAEMQKSILPDSPPSLAGYGLCGTMLPAKLVGGDFYDFIPVFSGPETIGVLIGDISDKGLYAAMYMVQLHTRIHDYLSLLTASAAMQKRYTNEKLLLWLNNQILQNEKSDMLATLTYGTLDARDHTFRFTRAGHERPYAIDAEGNEIYNGQGFGQAIGFTNHPTLDSDQINIPTGGLVALYTDGLADETDSGMRMFGRERLNALIRENRLYPADRICGNVMAEMEAYRDGTPQFDDCTLMIIKRDA